MNNKQLAERFAEGKQSGKASNMFIDGQTIYSYGYHFAIARHITGSIVLVNSEDYSHSTQRQKSHVLNALQEAGKKIIEAPGCAIEHAQEYLLEKIKEASFKATRAKKHQDMWIDQAAKYRVQLATLEGITQ